MFSKSASLRCWGNIFLKLEALKGKTRNWYDPVVGNVSQWPHWESETFYKKNLALMEQQGGYGDGEGEIYLGQISPILYSWKWVSVIFCLWRMEG